MAANSPAIDGANLLHAQSYLGATDILGNPRFNRTLDVGAIEFTGTSVPLVDLSISDTLIDHSLRLDERVAAFFTTSVFSLEDIVFSLVEEKGLNNDYFGIQGNELLLRKELTTEALLRIKVRVTHNSGAWLKEYFYLHTGIVTALDKFEGNDVQVYPIPASKSLYFDHVRPGSTYTIYSVNGKVLAEGSFLENYHVSVEVFKMESIS